MNGVSGSSAASSQAYAQRIGAMKDQENDGDSDDQKVSNQASAQRTQTLQQLKQAGVGGNVDISA